MVQVHVSSWGRQTWHGPSRHGEEADRRTVRLWPIFALLPVLIVGQIKATGFTSLVGIDTTVLSVAFLLGATAVAFLRSPGYPARRCFPSSCSLWWCSSAWVGASLASTRRSRRGTSSSSPPSSSAAFRFFCGTFVTSGDCSSSGLSEGRLLRSSCYLLVVLRSCMDAPGSPAPRLARHTWLQRHSSWVERPWAKGLSYRRWPFLRFL